MKNRYSFFFAQISEEIAEKRLKMGMPNIDMVAMCGKQNNFWLRRGGKRKNSISCVVNKSEALEKQSVQGRTDLFRCKVFEA